MSSRLVVLSDLHLAPAGPLCNFHSHAALADCLHAQARPDTTLILNGDTFDLLQDANRPRTLALPTAPERLRAFLAMMRQEEGGAVVLNALRSVISAGASCAVLPGNHDLELFHPQCRGVILAALGLPESQPNLWLHTTGQPFHTSVGRWQVTIGHGHRGDGWNDATPQTLQRALATGNPNTTLPPGSRLVTEVLRPFALAVDPTSGLPRFPFLDLLKPELPAVPLLLLYLDPFMGLSHLHTALGLSAASLVRAVRRWLARGPVLGAVQPSAEEGPEDDLAASLVEALEENERAATLRTIEQLQSWLAGHVSSPTPGTLASHNGIGRALFRSFLRRASYEDTFFDRQGQSTIDRGLMAHHLPEASGPRVLLAGHTHAAREIRLPGDRIYLNTGTWTDLMALPRLDDSESVRRFINELGAGRLQRRRHLTYAVVTTEGAELHEWAAAANNASSLFPGAPPHFVAPSDPTIQARPPGLRPTSASTRQLMQALLPTNTDLDAFCLAYFPAVHQRFVGTMDRDARTNRLLDVADSAEILRCLHASNPEAWEQNADILEFT